MALRDYQRRALNDLYDSWSSGRHKNPLIVAPTGSGKSAIIAAFCQEALSAYPTTRIVVATHVGELVKQNFDRLKSWWPAAPAGIVSAQLRRREYHSPIVFGSIQSLSGHELDLQWADVIIVDEAQLISSNETGQYRKFIDGMRRLRTETKVLGLTATPYRLDSGSLLQKFKGVEPIFDGIASEITVKELLDGGYVCPIVSPSTETRIDVSGIAKRGGDFLPSALRQAVDQGDLNAKIAAELIELGRDRLHWLVFCVGVPHADHMRDLLRAGGIDAASISAKTPIGERNRIINDYRAGRLRCITNADLLTVGFDAPATDFIGLVRPTQSPGLYVQIIGRGMRISPGKVNCLVADFAGNTQRHGTIENVCAPHRPEEALPPGVPLTKECPQCKLIHPVQQVKCPCGHEWPRDYYAKLVAKAAHDEFLASQPETAWFDVQGVAYSAVSTQDGTKRMLRVEYDLGLNGIASELVLIEHTNAYPRFRGWWLARCRLSTPIPGDVPAALHLQSELATPRRVKAQRSGKYWNVIDHEFNRWAPDVQAMLDEQKRKGEQSDGAAA